MEMTSEFCILHGLVRSNSPHAATLELRLIGLKRPLLSNQSRLGQNSRCQYVLVLDIGVPDSHCGSGEVI
jgi:hypothetical protein